MDPQPRRTTSRRIRAAMESGFLNARGNYRDALLKEYGLWCWRMGLPLLWLEAPSPHSRFTRVHLDLFTTPGRLTTRGHAELIGVSARHVPAAQASVSADGAVWHRLNHRDAPEFARAIFRVIRRKGNYEVAAQRAPAIRPAPVRMALSA